LAQCAASGHPATAAGAVAPSRNESAFIVCVTTRQGGGAHGLRHPSGKRGEANARRGLSRVYWKRFPSECFQRRKRAGSASNLSRADRSN
jgi:hypothetical protein